MPRKIYNFFITSAHRDINESVYNFKMNLATNAIKIEDDETVIVNVNNFSMMNSIYNISSNYNNNYFIVKRTDSDGVSNPINTTYNITAGNYSVINFCSLLNSLLSGIITVSYNQYQNTYTFKKTDLSGYKYFINPSVANKLLGLNTITEITAVGITGSFVDMVNFNMVILRVGNLIFDKYCYENIKSSDNLLDNSDVLFWVDRGDVQPFKSISYINQGANTFSYELLDKSIETFQLYLTNENNQFIKDAPDYYLMLQFVVQPKNEININNNVNQILIIINDIYELLLMGLKYIGFFKSIKK